jgi:hypothetical protein
MKDKPSAPQTIVVPAGQTASTQATFNKDAALQQRALNMVDQYTPQGSTVYEETGTETQGIPQMKVTQSLSPEQQALYDSSNRLAQEYGNIGETQLGAVKSTLETPFTHDAFGTAPTIDEGVRNATRDSMLARLQPQMTADRNALETSLTNQGFVTGSQGWNDAMLQDDRAQNDMYLGADVASGNEMSRMYGLQTDVRNRSIEDALRERNQPLTELSSFMGGSQPTGPTFLPTPSGQIAPPDFMGAAYGSANQQNAGNQNAYNQQMGSYNNNIAGLYGLAGAGAQGVGYNWNRG